MSAANAAAKKRRAPAVMEQPIPTRRGNPVPVSPYRNGPESQQATGLTLPQVIAVIDRRLLNLEKLARDSPIEILRDGTRSIDADHGSVDTDASLADFERRMAIQVEEFDARSEEFERRFDVLVDEIDGMKSIILSLQSYTMSVNKLLLDQSGILSSEIINTPSLPDPVLEIVPIEIISDVSSSNIIDVSSGRIYVDI
jgi:hypothetical protein